MSTENLPSCEDIENYERYLEREGVNQVITRALSNLYSEIFRPEDPMKYIRDKVAEIKRLETHDELKNKLEAKRKLIVELQEELKNHRAKLAALKEREKMLRETENEEKLRASKVEEEKIEEKQVDAGDSRVLGETLEEETKDVGREEVEDADVGGESTDLVPEKDSEVLEESQDVIRSERVEDEAAFGD